MKKGEGEGIKYQQRASKKDREYRRGRIRQKKGRRLNSTAYKGGRSWEKRLGGDVTHLFYGIG